MIKLGDRYEIERDSYCWRLRAFRTAVTKTGPKLLADETYHSSLEGVAKQIVELEAGKCQSASELLTLLRNINSYIEKIYDYVVKGVEEVLDDKSKAETTADGSSKRVRS